MYYFNKNIFFLLFLPGFFLSQNLVPNGDFETYSDIPSEYAKTNFAIGWSNIKDDKTGSAPEYFHTAGNMPVYFGQIVPFSGQGQMGLTTWHSSMPQFREYISAKLSKPLVKGEKYAVSFYLSNGKNNTYSFTSANFAVHFSENTLRQKETEPVNAEPQYEIKSIIRINNGWQKYSFTYKAEADMNYITFGNFRNDSLTLVSDTGSNGAYYFIDKIEVIQTTHITHKKDAEIVAKTSETEMEEEKYDATNKRSGSFPIKEMPRTELKNNEDEK